MKKHEYKLDKWSRAVIEIRVSNPDSEKHIILNALIDTGAVGCRIEERYIDLLGLDVFGSTENKSFVGESTFGSCQLGFDAVFITGIINCGFMKNTTDVTNMIIGTDVLKHSLSIEFLPKESKVIFTPK
ncbi:MAG: hypothetical protein JKY53_05530 [Flavobacteriales bacterium]|nr:hypothetical protein [Flavobacteriales bacterium]